MSTSPADPAVVKLARSWNKAFLYAGIAIAVGAIGYQLYRGEVSRTWHRLQAQHVRELVSLLQDRDNKTTLMRLHPVGSIVSPARPMPAELLGHDLAPKGARIEVRHEPDGLAIHLTALTYRLCETIRTSLLDEKVRIDVNDVVAMPAGNKSTQATCDRSRTDNRMRVILGVGA